MIFGVASPVPTATKRIDTNLEGLSLLDLQSVDVCVEIYSCSHDEMLWKQSSLNWFAGT
jgi:hypothetical protein